MTKKGRKKKGGGGGGGDAGGQSEDGAQAGASQPQAAPTQPQAAAPTQPKSEPQKQQKPQGSAAASMVTPGGDGPPGASASQQQTQGPSQSEGGKGKKQKQKKQGQQQGGPPGTGPRESWGGQQGQPQPQQQAQQERGPPGSGPRESSGGQQKQPQQQRGPPGSGPRESWGGQQKQPQQQRGPPGSGPRESWGGQQKQPQQQRGPPGSGPRESWGGHQGQPQYQAQQQEVPPGPPGAGPWGAQGGPPGAGRGRGTYKAQQQQAVPPYQQQGGLPGAGLPGAWGGQQGQPQYQAPQQGLPSFQQQGGLPAAGPPGAWGGQPGQPQYQTPQFQQQGGLPAAAPPGAWGGQQGQPQYQAPQQGMPQFQQQGGLPEAGPPGAWGGQQGYPQQQQPMPPTQTLKTPPAGQRQKQPSEPSTPEDLDLEFSKLSTGGSGKKQKSPQVPAVKSSISAHQQIEMARRIPKRRDMNKGGSKGRRITVEANVVKLSIDRRAMSRYNGMATHYDVTFDPNTPKFMLKFAWAKFVAKYFPGRSPAFDGRKNCFSAGDLPCGQGMTGGVEVDGEDEKSKPRAFQITLNKVANINLDWLAAVRPGIDDTERDQLSIQVLDVILRHAPQMKCATVGRSFFSPPKGQVLELGGGMEIWYGLFQSAILGWNTYFNVDVVHKGFPSPLNVMDVFQQVAEHPKFRNPVTPRDFEDDRIKSKVEKFLRNLKVVSQIPGEPTSKRSYNVNGLAAPARFNKFKLANGQQTTVEAYYRDVKRYTIRNPLFPCLWVGPKLKNICVPAEICTVQGGQVTQKPLNDSQTGLMVRKAATDTKTRKRKILDAFNQINYNQDPCMREFGISIGGKFEEVPARVLDPPMLEYQNLPALRIEKGVWKSNRFLHSAMLEDKSWTILCLEGRTTDNDLRRLQDQLILSARQVGMSIGVALTPFGRMNPPRGHDLRQLEDYVRSNRRLKLIVIVIPDSTEVYSKVKQVAELRIGVLTQCLKSSTLFKLNQSTGGNLILKINAKLNGTNHTLSMRTRPKCLDEPCMIVGADVTHPTPDAGDNIPSIVGVVASHDPRAFKYNTQIRLQPPRTEIILGLKDIMVIHLQYFLRVTGQKPLRIIIFRDGVSEGQLTQVMHYELEAIKAACIKVQADGTYRPLITFLVVQKRHHIRLFPTNPRDSDDRNGNVQAGTIVDTQITHPCHVDFYLVSHASIQGTARPTKYRLLCDDSQMSEDEIEELTYYLCHMFTRCTRSVSYPAPTYYAHLAAFRARALTHQVPIDVNDLEQEQLRKLTFSIDMSVAPMFFV